MKFVTVYIVLGLVIVLFFPGCAASSTSSGEQAVVNAPTATPETIAAPVLLAPVDGAIFDSPLGVLLDWEWERPLQGPEFYDVRVWQADDPHNGISWTPVSDLDLSGWLAGREPGTYYWTVAVVAGRDNVVEKFVTGESDTRHFTISSTALPTATPLPTETLIPTATLTTTPLPVPAADSFDAAAFLEGRFGGSPMSRRDDLQRQQAALYYSSHAACVPGPDWELDTSDWEAYAESISPHRQGFADALRVSSLAPGTTPAIHERIPLFERNDVRFEYVVFESRYEGVRVEGYLLTPLADPPPNGYPAVIAFHGTGGSPEAVVLLSAAHEDYTHGVGDRLAQAGAVVFAPHINIDNDRYFELESMARLSVGASALDFKLQMGFSVVDFLQSESNVNPAGIGTYGISWGGLLSMYAAALDTRIHAAVVSGFARNFTRYVYEHPTGRIIPLLYVLEPSFWCSFDADRVGMLIAPRYALYEYGIADTETYAGDITIFTEPLATLEALYETLGAPERFGVAVHPGSHEIDGTEAIPWLIEALREAE